MKKILFVILCLISISVYAINPKSNGEVFSQNGLKGSVSHEGNAIILDEEIKIEKRKSADSAEYDSKKSKKKA